MDRYETPIFVSMRETAHRSVERPPSGEARSTVESN